MIFYGLLRQLRCQPGGSVSSERVNANISGIPDRAFVWALDAYDHVFLVLISSAGVLRFAGVQSVVPFHDQLSEWATQTGVPSVFLAFHYAVDKVAPGVWPLSGFGLKSFSAVLALAFGTRLFLQKHQREPINSLIAALPLFYVVRAGTTRNSFLPTSVFLATDSLTMQDT
jgi:hypothetical protein